jgi:Tol biopolymer transport system component
MKATCFLLLVCGLVCAAQIVTPLSDRSDGLGSPALSPDGRTLAYDAVGPDYSIWIDVRPLSGGNAIHFAGWRDSGGPHGARWSPDGKRIAFLRYYCHSCNLKLFVKEFPKGPEKLLGEVCGGTPSWTPDGRFLIATELAGKNAGWDPCRLVLVPLDGGARVRLAKEGDELALTADRKRLAYAAGNIVKTVHLDADYRFADTPVEIAKEPHVISSLHWSGEGGTLVYQVWNCTKAVTDGVARLIRLGGDIGISEILADGSALGTERRGSATLWRFDLKATPLVPEKVRSIPWTDEDLSVSLDGQQVAFVTARNGPTQIWVSRMDGSEARVLIPSIPPFDHYGDNTAVDGLSWSPDGKWIALQTEPGVGHGDTSERTFIVPSAAGRLRKVGDYGFGQAPVWSEDGKALYVTKYSDSYEESDFVADVATGRLSSIANDRVPRLPLVPLPEGSGRSHVAQGGRYLYYEAPADWKPRLVKVEGLLLK